MSRLSETFNKALLSTLLESLLRVRASIEDGYANTSEALCSLTADDWSDNGTDSHSRADLCTVRRHLYHAWPKFSGNSDFPVPGAGGEGADEIAASVWARYKDGRELDFGISADVADAYFNAVYDGDLHDGDMWVGDYGNLRHELLQFMIDELTKESIA